IVSGCSLLRSCLTSASWRCLVVSYGLTSKASKLGSPAPGTMIEQKPALCEIPRMSSNGQKSTLSMRCPLFPQLRYGDWTFDGLEVVDILKISFHIVTAVPAPTAASPRSEMDIE